MKIKSEEVVADKSDHGIRPTELHLVRASGTPISFLLFLSITVMLQIRNGSFTGEFNNDDAGHYFSITLIYDWLLSGFHENPFRYAIAYFAHYPFIGLGHWGPFYYIVGAFWTLLFGYGKASVILLAGCTCAAVATITARIITKRTHWVLGVVAATIFVVAPLVQSSASALMLDLPIALLGLLSALFYTRYLITENWRFSMGFGVSAAAAILTKGNGFALALLPILALLLYRRPALLLRPSFWAPLPLVILVVGPWYFMNYSVATSGFRHPWGWPYTQLAVPGNLSTLLWALGPVVFVVAVVAVVAGLRRGFDAVGACAAALLASVFIFQGVVPSEVDPRYMIVALPPLLILAADGAALSVAGLCRLLQRQIATGVSALGVGVLMFAPLVTAWGSVEPKPNIGFVETSADILSKIDPTNPVMLIAAGMHEESEFAVEIAMRDHARPDFYVVRGSRLLGGGGYDDYQPLYNSVDEVRSTIDKYSIPLIVLSTSKEAHTWPHNLQVERLMQIDASRWNLILRHPQPTGEGEILVYERRDSAGTKVDPRQLVELAAPRRFRH